ncbi:MAG: DNA polymerase III subunit delta [Anaerolineaceae bacterium]|nr:DNA polymerase III subunit delta [Anaerolineaceae bacterium]
MSDSGTQTKSVYILHGDDEFSMSRKVEEMVKHFADPATADLNLTRLNGGQASEADIRTAAMSLPFLSAQRVVVLDHPLARIKNKDDEEKYVDFLNKLPETTVLILVIDDHYRNIPIKGQWQKVWQVVGEKHWLRKWVNEAGNRAAIRTYQMPQKGEMTRWIMSQAKQLGGEFNPVAASVLADYVGGETRVASLEITKLLTYVNFARPVEVDDVERLTPYANPPNIFEMVDALAMENVAQAQKVFHELLETDDPGQLFGMVVRQFRLLIQAREILDEGGDGKRAMKEIEEMKSKFVADKALRQAQRFQMADLEAIYCRLLALDSDVKQGETSYELGIDLLIAEMRR